MRTFFRSKFFAVMAVAAIAAAGVVAVVPDALAAPVNLYKTLVVAKGGIQLGGTGQAISDSYSDDAETINFASIAAQTCTDSSAITVTGAVANDVCVVGLPAAIEAGLAASCFVSASDAVKIRLCNVTAGAVDPASATFTVRVFDP